jgi:hypothetical protein
VAKQAHIWSPETALCIDGREDMLKISLKTAFFGCDKSGMEDFLCFFLDFWFCSACCNWWQGESCNNNCNNNLLTSAVSLECFLDRAWLGEAIFCFHFVSSWRGLLYPTLMAAFPSPNLPSVAEAVAIESWLQRDLEPALLYQLRILVSLMSAEPRVFFVLYLWLWRISPTQLLGLIFKLQSGFGLFFGCRLVVACGA